MIPEIITNTVSEVPESLKQCFTCTRRNSSDKEKSYCTSCTRNVNYHDSYRADDMLIKLIGGGYIKEEQ